MEEERIGTAEKMTTPSAAAIDMATDNSNNNNTNRDTNEFVPPAPPPSGGGGGGGGETGGKNESKKAKSCKGCLYYSSTFKSDSRNPFCFGIPGSVPQVPRYIVGKSELEASQLGSSFKDFTYGCVGYSVYSDTKGQSKDMQDAAHSELPVCVGIEVFVDRKVTTADSAPAHVHNREGSNFDHIKSPQSRTQKPVQSVGDEFLKRFTRNAGVVATGVAKNVRRVGNQLKASLDDILYPFKRPPK